MEEDGNESNVSIDLRDSLRFSLDQISKAFGADDLDLIAVSQDLHLDLGKARMEEISLPMYPLLMSWSIFLAIMREESSSEER